MRAVREVRSQFAPTAQAVAEAVRARLDAAATSYYRLVLIVGSAGGGKTTTLKLLNMQDNLPYVNVGLELSRRLMDLSESERPRLVAELFGDIVSVAAAGHQTVLLDNIEVLFLPELKLDPLRLLQSTSRQLTVVAAWPGGIAGGYLTYAEAGHPESRRYPSHDLEIVETAPGGVPLEKRGWQQ